MTVHLPKLHSKPLLLFKKILTRIVLAEVAASSPQQIMLWYFLTLAVIHWQGYSLSHLLLPDHLPPCVTAQTSNPSPIFPALLTPNQRVKTTFLLRLPGRRVSALFMVLAVGGVEAETVVGAP